MTPISSSTPRSRAFISTSRAATRKTLITTPIFIATCAKRIPDAIVLNNPGTVCAADYVARPAADVVCLFERDRAFDEFRPPAWASRFPASRFCVQAYHVDTEAEMKRALRRAVQLRVGYVYITDDVGPNPYDRLPTYWDAEVDAVREINR